MNNFQIISDGSCDLSDELIKKNNVIVVPFYVSLDGEHYLKEKEDIKVRDFYQKMVDSPTTFPKTSMPTVADYEVEFEKVAREGKDIICICITTKFSGSYNSAIIAKKNINNKYPNVKVEVIDAMMNTCIQGLLVLEACRMQQSGLRFEETVEKINEIKKTGRIFFTVGNMDYLRHGGRIGKVVGAIGATLKIKPLIVLKEGEIFPLGIAFTRKLSIIKVIDHLKKYIHDEKIDINDYQIIVGYGYDKEEGELFRKKVMEAIGREDISLGQIGATIGVHTGPYPLGLGIIKKFDS